jgi:hypothetical protein
MPAACVLIFVFAGVSYGRSDAILAEFEPVPNAPSDVVPESAPDGKSAADPVVPEEIGGPKGPEPTRYGDWEKNGRCVDF